MSGSELRGDSQRAFEAAAPYWKWPILWIDWGRRVRTHSMARELETELWEIDVQGSRASRYMRCIVQTYRMLRRRRPRVVIATNPSIVLGCFLLLVRRVLGFRLVSDAHYAGVALVGTWRRFQPLLDWHNRNADLVIVTNENHLQRISSLGGKAYVCPDPVPKIERHRSERLRLPDRSAFLVCSFQLDEPYLEVFQAFKGLSKEGFSLYVSGNHASAAFDPSDFPWVQFLGYIPAEEYYNYMASCAVVIDLTILEDCLVCGAYEALALHQPLILSNTGALSTYFGSACVLTENDAASIVVSVRSAVLNRDAYREQARKWVLQNTQFMREKIEGLRRELQLLCE